MSGIDWEAREYQDNLYRMRYTTRAPRDPGNQLGINSEGMTGEPASPYRVRGFPIKSWCRIAYSSDRVWSRRLNGSVVLKQEPMDWLADRGFRLCLRNSYRDEWDTKVWHYGWKDNDSPPCGLFFFGEPDIALLFKLTWA